MTVTVLLFASYASALRTHSLAVELIPGSTVRDAIGHVRELAGGHSLPSEIVVAVNERYVKQDRVLHTGDTVAIIPPVAGG